MTSPRLRRLARGSVSAAFATYAALFAHIAGGGEMPGLLGLVAPLVLSIAACTFLSGQRLSLLRLGASVGVAQLLFHGLFVLGAARAAATTSTSAHAGHSASATAAAMAAMPAGSGHLDGGVAMWIGHAVAAGLTIAALFFAERLLDAVSATGRRVSAWLARLLHPLAVCVGSVMRGAPAVFAAIAAPVVAERSTGASRRGPPLVA